MSRLIDADALVAEIDREIDDENRHFPVEIGEALDMIEKAPTIHICPNYNIEDHFCPTWCETIKKTSEDLQRTYQKELDKLAKIEQICKDAFSNPETLDINLYRAQALANIYHLFLYDVTGSQMD